VTRIGYTKRMSNKKRHHLAKYPWESWLRKGSTHTIVYRKHFTCSLNTMLVYLRQKASRDGRRVSIKTVDNNTLRFKVVA
jgi:hypothetical protein